MPGRCPPPRGVLSVQQVPCNTLLSVTALFSLGAAQTPHWLLSLMMLLASIASHGAVHVLHADRLLSFVRMCYWVMSIG